MRGELRAIDLGYDSRHLHVLGQIGMQDQILKKKLVEWEKRLKEDTAFEKEYTEKLAKNTVGTEEYKKNEESLKRYQISAKKLQTELDALKEYKNDLDLFKDSIWNKRVNSKEEMEAAENQVNDFFASHQDQKYAFLQSLREGHAPTFNYAKEEAKAHPVMLRDTRQTQQDYEQTVFQTATMFFAWKIDEKAMEKNIAQIGRISKSGVAADEKMPAELDQGCKEVADSFLTTINRKISELEKEPSEYPHAMDFQKAFLRTHRIELENYRAGIPMNKESAYRDPGNSHYFSMSVQLDPNCFQPDMLETTEKAVQEYGLDKHAEAFLKLQERYQAFEMGKDYMQPEERHQVYQDLMADKRAMIESVKALQQKMANPTPELITLFSGKKAQLNDFIGARGLQGIINSYERDLARVDMPQAKGIDKAMEKFNSARASVFKDESPEHKQMREAGEKVQENIKKLQSGVIKDEKAGKVLHTITQEERDALMKQTWDSMKTLEEKADQYIAHATKNGTKIPHTPAGKARLAGALDLKKLNEQMEKHLGRESSLFKKMTDRANKLGKAGAETLAEMDKEVDKFAKMSQAEYHDQTPESMAFDLDKCEYQAARVIAIATVEEAAMQGKVNAKDIKNQVLSNQKEIAKDPAFKNWIKSDTTKAKMKNMGNLTAKEVRADFVERMTKDIEKSADKKEKTKTMEKNNTKKSEVKTFKM
ncbi:MAG: hypothetical protein K5697_00915, partial [Lachnospiraceae bacterium]|nr:hypothetical protein [Lachnospiraceae bacterium]